MALKSAFHKPSGVLAADLVSLWVEIERVARRPHFESQLGLPESPNIPSRRGVLRVRARSRRLAENLVESLSHNLVFSRPHGRGTQQHLSHLIALAESGVCHDARFTREH